MTKKIVCTIVVALLIIATVSGILIYEDKNIEINKYDVTSNALPTEFDGYRIAHISDLHNAVFGKDNSELIDILKIAEPDIIAITGDIIDSRRTDVDISLAFVKEIKKIAPCYYVTGNHEARVGNEYAVLKDGMIREGVVILENDVLTVGCENAYIEVIGLEDPTFSVSGSTETEAEVVADKLRKLTGSEKDFTLLLSHKPEFFDIYVENGIDLVLSGHTHGGQFIIPFIGGLIAPGQGFFPEFDSGFFEKEGTKMIVSRGLGNSIIPLRVNNRPEVILIELHCGY